MKQKSLKGIMGISDENICQNEFYFSHLTPNVSDKHKLEIAIIFITLQ